ncbi:MAG: isoprenylcysteine carboxylmethyltransferase family protein [Verrucomicrobiota bacterium]
MQFLELRVPPLVVALFMAGLGWFVAWMTPTLGFVLPPRNAIVLTLFVAGTGVALLGIASFRRARTTLNPLKPEQASGLVTSGVYRCTRNPMYLGMLLILLGWTICLSNGPAFVVLPAFSFYLNRFQIAPEERALSSIFSQEFAAYQLKVRRWL